MTTESLFSSQMALSNLRNAGFIQEAEPGQHFQPVSGQSCGYRLERQPGESNAPTEDGQPPLVSVVTVVKDDAEGLEETIKCIKQQKYSNIEHIIIDGDSSNRTALLAICSRYGVALALSEPDRGIYDAMNKGISYAQGEYICILNAGDTYAEDFIHNAYQALEPDDNLHTIAYGGIAGEDTAEAMSSGILLHHLHINHQSFMVPTAVYKEIGGYSTLYRVVSDIAWARVAFLKGIRFVYVGPDQLSFAAGGLSSSAKYRELIKRENAELNKAVFAELSTGQAQEVYEFRFRPVLAQNICNIAETSSADLKDSLHFAVGFLLKSKAFILKQEEVDSTFIGLFELCSRLGIQHSRIQFTNSPNGFNASCSTIEAYRESCSCQPQKRRLLHYAEVFSRPSETFIYDIIKRNEILADAECLILCDQRLLTEERPHPYVVCLKWSAVHPVIREAIYGLLFSMEWSCVICHFGINSVRLLLRLPRYQWGRHRYLHMMHGIDVFILRDPNNKAYRSTLVNHIAKLSNHSFTTPSKFLKARAGLEGLPMKKIAVVHNCANSRFYQHRKRGGFLSSREGHQVVRLLAVGRLIQWKNHSILLTALARLKEITNISFHLTIVYGKDNTLQSSLASQIQDEGLNGKVELVEFVDFNEEPAYFGHFDLFIMPSGYSTDGMRKTETFGVATLEAIASGLPVLVSDAGASKEILDHAEPGSHAMVFKHNNAEDLSNRLNAMLQDKRTFTDNDRMAQQILKKYSEELQISLLWHAIDRHPSKTLSVIQFSADATGGAGGAAWRCHQGLREAGANSIFVCRKFNRLPNDHAFSEIVAWNDTPEQRYNSLQPPQSFSTKPGNSIFSVDEKHFSAEQLTQLVNGFDIIHLNWVSRFLTIQDIAHLSTLLPVIYTVRDMNPITGGCHYLHGCKKLVERCESPCPQTDYQHRLLPNDRLNAKISSWSLSRMTFIGISKLTSEVVKASAIGRMAKGIETVQNGFTTDYMKLLPVEDAKKRLGIEVDERVILFVPSYSSSVKGADIAIRALRSLTYHHILDDCIVLIAGEVKDDELDLGHIRHRKIGYIGNRRELNYVYAACDLVLVPSLEETFSNTCAEAMLCGAPVVGFRSGAIPEMIIDGETGYLAEDYHQESLSGSIKSALNKTWDREAIRMSLLARFSIKENSKKHLKIYQQQLGGTAEKPGWSHQVQLYSVDRMIHLYKQRLHKRVLTVDSGLDTTNALVSGCKKAIVWISTNGHLCFTQLGSIFRHYIYAGPIPSGLSLAGLRPISRLVLTETALSPKAYSGQSLRPLAEFQTSLNSNGIYLTLSGNLAFNVRSRDGDQLITTFSALASCMPLDDAMMYNLVS